ncbi:MAG: hypothetical protein QOH05_223, partial [Acetobacteraceae bacterium]|nr:hypothetical protein [Acetobacteraceae bacterium]
SPAVPLGGKSRAGSATLPATALTERQIQGMWASAMTDVAAEYTTNLVNLPPAERRLASHRATVLSTCATDLLSGSVSPRPTPGPLDAMMRSSTR